MKEFKKELLTGNKKVLIKTAEQAKDLVLWIYDNVDKKYYRYPSPDWVAYIGKYIYVSHEFGNCYEWSNIGLDSISFNDALEEECQFVKYGFKKPDFECEILGKDNGKISAIVFTQNATPNICIYDLLGACYQLDTVNSKILRWERKDLTPIKKPWYEDKNNFPCLCYTEDEDIPQTIQHITEFDELGFVGRHPIKNECIRFKEVRRLTKEEVLSLYSKGN